MRARRRCISASTVSREASAWSRLLPLRAEEDRLQVREFRSQGLIIEGLCLKSGDEL
jgi:hypothetical protein